MDRNTTLAPPCTRQHGLYQGLVLHLSRNHRPLATNLSGTPFLAFMSLMAGLAICHAVVALSMPSARLRHATLATLQVSVLLYLTYLFFTPRYFDGRRWFLAVCEWVVSALIVSGTVSLAALFRGWQLQNEN